MAANDRREESLDHAQTSIRSECDEKRLSPESGVCGASNRYLCCRAIVRIRGLELSWTGGDEQGKKGKKGRKGEEIVVERMSRSREKARWIAAGAGREDVVTRDAGYQCQDSVRRGRA
jgi:hypothetical protein